MSDKLYRITLTGEQLDIVQKAVEDWARFLSGQCEMSHATAMIEDPNMMNEVRDLLARAHDLVVPELPGWASYSWNGGGCPNERQRRAMIMGYMIYREILHRLTVERGIDNVYSSPTLIHPDQGPLIGVERLA